MVAVNIVEQFKVDLNAPASPTTVATLTNTPQTNDLIMVVAGSSSDGSIGASAVAGAGATWTRHSLFENPGATQAHTAAVTPVYLGRGGTSTAAITLTHSSFRGTVWVFHLRAADGSYLSAIEHGLKIAAASGTTPARTLHADDKVFAVYSVAAGTGTPSWTPSAAFDAAATGKDDLFVETSLGYRTATGDETFTAALSATATRTGVVSTIHVTADPQPDKQVFGLMTRISANASTPVVIPVTASEFLANDLVVVAVQIQQSTSSLGLTVSGLGATWTIDRTGESSTSGEPTAIMAFGRGATTPGNVTVTPDAGLAGTVSVAVVRGLSSTAASAHTTDKSANGSATTLTATALEADLGEVVLDVATLGGSNANGTFPNPGVPATDWRSLDGWGGSFEQGRIAYRYPTADDQSHQTTVTSTVARWLRIEQWRLGEVVAGQSGALGRATENDAAGLVRSGPPGTMYEEAPFPGVNWKDNNWFAQSIGITTTYDDGVIEWEWPYAYATGFQLQTRRTGRISTILDETFLAVEWQIDAVESGVTPDMRMKNPVGSNESDLLTEDLGDGWYRSWFEPSMGDNEPSGPYFEWSGIAQGGKVRVRRLLTSRTLGDYYAVFKAHPVTDTGLPWALTGSQTYTAPLDKVTETDAANAVTPPLFGDLGRAVETDTGVPLVIPQYGDLGRAEESDSAGTLTLPQFGDLGRAEEADSAGGLTVPPEETDTTNRVGGRARHGYGVATWEPAVVPAPPPLLVDGVPVGGSVILAQAFGPVTMSGATPTFSVSQAQAPRARQRILYGGRDITYFRDVVTPDVTYGLAEPLLYGPGTLSLPQVSGIFEEPGVSPGVGWLEMGKEVVVQTVLDDVVVDEVYRGLSVAWEPDGTGVTVELGGEAQGRAAMQGKQQPIFRDFLDIGRLAWRAIRDLHLPFEPRLGPETGIESATFGADSLVDYIDELCARGWTRGGAQWTVMPDEAGTYRMAQKDTGTVHFTVFCDDALSVPALRRDLAEEPNRVYATGVTPAGQRVRFGVYPGLQQGRVPDYPMAGGAAFNVGTTNEDTIDGFGISVMVNRLYTVGLLSLADKPGGYDEDVRQAVITLRERAGTTPTPGPDLGQMDPATWRVLWDLDKTGYSLRGSSIQPAAQRSYTRPYRRSASGAVIGRNRKYDPHRPKVDLQVDMGSGHRRGKIRDWAEAEVDRGEDNYVGTIALYGGAVLRGDVPTGAAVTPEMLMDAREIRPGMNGRVRPGFGSPVVHVAAVDVTPESVTLTVDTQARDAPKVWEIIERNRETRNDPARRRRGPRASTEVKDSIDPWDEVGGTLDNAVDLVEGWNVVQVVAGQEGTVSRIRLEVLDAEGDGVESACAVLGRRTSAARLNHLVPDPLTEAGARRWENRKVAAALRERDLLYAAGTDEEPCGYSPGRKSKDDPLTGLHRDDAGFSYRTGPEPVLYLAVFVRGAAALSGGRVMWNQLEAGA